MRILHGKYQNAAPLNRGTFEQRNKVSRKMTRNPSSVPEPEGGRSGDLTNSAVSERENLITTDERYDFLPI